MLDLLLRRLGIGLITLWLVSTLVFAATQILPGNAARAVLSNTVTPARLAALESQMHLNRPIAVQYLDWIGGIIRGNPGASLVNQGSTVLGLVGDRVGNSAALVALAAIAGVALGLTLGIISAVHRNGRIDRIVSVIALTITALPEFIVAIALIILLATLVLHVLPAVSIIPAGASPWANPSALVLPVLTLTLVIFPYIARMTRAAVGEALDSEYVELARLKGVPARRILLVHALPNAAPAIIQVIGVNLLYLAGGIVVVETVFNFAGIGQLLVSAIAERDIPVIQFTVLVLAGFYIVVNIGTDLAALSVTPRRRFPKAG